MLSATTTCSPEAHWLETSVADLEGLSRDVSPALRRRLDAIFARLARMNGGTSLLDAMQRPASTPFVALIDAFAGDLGLAGHPAVALLGRSTVLLYVYVRVQDDLVDEPERVDRASVYAAEALLARHLTLFAAATTEPRAFACRSALMCRFAGVAATEVDERDCPAEDDDALAWIGEKFLPMAVPLVGLAALAGQMHQVDDLIAFVREIGTALQLLNDAFNLAEDSAAGRSTPVIRWLTAADVDVTGPLALARLLADPVHDRVILEATRHADAAAKRALALGWSHAAALAGRIRAMIDATPERLLRLTLGLSV